MARRRRSRGSSNGNRGAPTVWESSIFEVDHAIGGGQSVSDLTPLPMRTNQSGTAICQRLLIKGQYQVDGAGASVNAQFTTVGICVVTNDAFFAAAVPDPLGDTTQGWYYWDNFTLNPQNINAAGTMDSHVLTDIKTKRRLRGGYKLVLVTEAPAGNDLATKIILSIRALWKIW